MATICNVKNALSCCFIAAVAFAMAAAFATPADWLQLPPERGRGQDNGMAKVYFDPGSLMHNENNPYWYTFNLIYNMADTDIQTDASSSVVEFTADCLQRQLRFERSDDYNAPDAGGELIETTRRGSTEFSALDNYDFDTEALFGLVCGP